MKTFFVSYRLDYDKTFLQRLNAIRQEIALIGEAWTHVPQFAVIRCDDDANLETVEWAFYRGGFDTSRDTMNIFEAHATAHTSHGESPDYPPPAFHF